LTIPGVPDTTNAVAQRTLAIQQFLTALKDMIAEELARQRIKAGEAIKDSQQGLSDQL
jgi:hypothetical protein